MEIEIDNPLGTKLENQCNVDNDAMATISFEESQETLICYIDQNKSVLLFLRLMGVIWFAKTNTLSNSIQILWTFIIVVGLLLFSVFGLLLVFGLVETALFTSNWAFDILFGVTILLQCVTMGFSLWDMKRRMSSKVSSHYCIHLQSGLKSSYIVLFISIVVGILPMMISDYVLMIGEIVLSCILTATMYFISTDCSVALFLLDYLLLQIKNECLTFEQFSLVRRDIDERQSFSSWINNSIVIVALLDIAAVLIFILSVSFSMSTLRLSITVMGLFFKEIPFLMVVYWQVAQVNEKSSILLKELGTKRWLGADGHSDVERHSVYINAQSKPIVMSLAGMKLKRRDLAWQFALWCFAFVVSIFKTAFEKRVL